MYLSWFESTIIYSGSDYGFVKKIISYERRIMFVRKRVALIVSSLVKKIVDLDRGAQERLLRLNNQKENLSLEINKQGREMEKDYELEMQHSYAILYDDLQRRKNLALEKSKLQEAEIKNMLLENFKSNEEEWLKKMLDLLKMD